MDLLFRLLLFNALSATVLALLAALVARLTRRPGIAHALWALVLLKLVFPPVIEMAVVPRAAVLPPPAAAASGGAPGERLRADAVPAAPTAAPPSLARDDGPGPAAVAAVARARHPALGSVPWSTLGWGVWGAGAAGLCGLTFVRAWRFRRLVAGGRPASRAFERAAARLAARMGVRCPVLRTVGARVSPMLWFPGGRPVVLFPAALLAALDAGERDALLAHELAHVRRRDHLLRFVELLATIAFWWHPVVWWARRRLRRLEEQSCDAVVLDALPGQGGPYARGLVKTVEFLAGVPARVPALASGAVRNRSVRHLEERLTMILNDTTPRLLSRSQRLLLAVVVAGALLIVPSWAEPRDDDPRSDEPGDVSRAASVATTADDQPAPDDADLRERLHDLERQSIELERSLQDLAARRRAIEIERARLERRRTIEILRAKAAAAERQGRPDDAARLRDRADDVERRSALEHERLQEETFHEQRARDLERELRGQRIAAEHAAAAGDTARARALRDDVTAAKRHLAELEAEREAARAAEHARLEAGLREHERALVESGRLEADRRAGDAERALALALEQRAREERARREAILVKLEAAEAEARRLESIGERDEAEALRREADRLRELLEAPDAPWRGRIY